MQDAVIGGVCFDVWPDNWPAIEVWRRIDTQWRWVSGMRNMRTGLSYVDVMQVIGVLGYTGEDAVKMFDDVQLMEREALDVWRQQAEDAENQT